MGDEISPTDFAASVVADIQRMETEDTAPAPSDAATDTGDTETSDTADAPDVDRDANGRLHGEDGKFVAEGEEAEETNEEAPEEEPADDGFVIEVDDEETADKVSKLLDKYDGDVAKALAAAVDAQSLVGRKAEDVAGDQIRALRAELEQVRLGQERTLRAISQPAVPITRELIEEDPATAAEQAVLQDNPQALEAAVIVWREENPDAAKFFLQKTMLEAQLAERAVAPQSTTTDTAASADAEVDTEVAKVLERHPDLEQHLPAIGKAAEANPLLKRAMETGSPAEKAQALEALTVIAKASQGADTSRDAMRRVQVRVKQEADDARRSARVVSASRGSAATASQPTRVDEFLAAFDARLGLKADQS